MGMNMPT